MRGCGVFILIIVLAVSCLEPYDCVQRRNNLVGVAFKNLEDGKGRTRPIDTVFAEGAEGAILAPGNYQSLILPLDYMNTTTTYTIEIADTVYSLVFTYDSKIEFVNDECGEKFVLSDLRLIAHNFDSVNLVNATPGVDKNAINLEIFD